MSELIDDIYDQPDKVKAAIDDLTWENAKVKSILVGYEDHGLLTVSIVFEGASWSQGFGCRNLGGNSNAFRNYIEGWLTIAPIHGVVGKVLRIGRSGSSIFERLVAARPLVEHGPVFWPGGEDRFYAFDYDGKPLVAPSQKGRAA